METLVDVHAVVLPADDEAVAGHGTAKRPPPWVPHVTRRPSRGERRSCDAHSLGEGAVVPCLVYADVPEHQGESHPVALSRGRRWIDVTRCVAARRVRSEIRARPPVPAVRRARGAGQHPFDEGVDHPADRDDGRPLRFLRGVARAERPARGCARTPIRPAAPPSRTFRRRLPRGSRSGPARRAACSARVRRPRTSVPVRPTGAGSRGG